MIPTEKTSSSSTKTLILENGGEKEWVMTTTGYSPLHAIQCCEELGGGLQLEPKISGKNCPVKQQ